MTPRASVLHSGPSASRSPPRPLSLSLDGGMLARACSSLFLLCDMRQRSPLLLSFGGCVFWCCLPSLCLPSPALRARSQLCCALPLRRLRAFSLASSSSSAPPRSPRRGRLPSSSPVYACWRWRETPLRLLATRAKILFAFSVLEKGGSRRRSSCEATRSSPTTTNFDPPTRALSVVVRAAFPPP